MEADMAVAVEYRGGSSYSCKSRNHEVITDLGPEQGGQDQGMTPPELLLSSLGSCAAYYATQYLKTHNLDTAGLSVHVRAWKAYSPGRIGRFEIQVESPAAEDPKHREGLLRAAHRCLVHKTLEMKPEVEIAAVAPALSAA